MYIFLSVNMYIVLSLYLFVCASMSVCLPVMYVYIPICLSSYLTFYISASPCRSISFWLYIHLCSSFLLSLSLSLSLNVVLSLTPHPSLNISENALKNQTCRKGLKQTIPWKNKILIFHIRISKLRWHHVFVPYVTIPNVTIPHVSIPNVRNNPERPFSPPLA